MVRKSGFVVILGETNSGKSTLVNSILGAKVSITSHKVQTTRFKVLGIYTKEDTQVSFVDTPGIFNPRRDFDKAMIRHSYAQISDGDIIMVLIDGQKGINDHTKGIINKLPKDKKSIIAINKIDLLSREELVVLIGNLKEYNDIFAEIFMISALKRKNLDKLLGYLDKEMPEHDWYFDEDQISDLPLRQLAAEITRERIYKYLNQELPYNIVVEPLKWEEDDNRIEIHQNIYVTKDNHKGIVLGNKGEKIKSIRVSAMEYMTKDFGKKVSLFLYVKVDKRLFEKKGTFDSIGLETAPEDE